LVDVFVILRVVITSKKNQNKISKKNNCISLKKKKKTENFTSEPSLAQTSLSHSHRKKVQKKKIGIESVATTPWARIVDETNEPSGNRTHSVRCLRDWIVQFLIYTPAIFLSCFFKNYLFEMCFTQRAVETRARHGRRGPTSALRARGPRSRAPRLRA
jgi:hypothetical protein